jgi:DNA-binding NtrC family response regulator
LSNGAILIVNDDADIAELFAAALQTGGFKTAVMDDASLAVGKIKDNPDEYSLVLVDLSSQQYSDFPKQVKRINDQIKVLLVSGFAFNDVEISKSPYDRILQLPITMSNLVSTVREVLGSNENLV